MIVDEIEFVDPKFLRGTLLPVLMERKTTFLAATSPQSEDTYFSYLCQVKNPRTGAKIFNVVYLVQVCKLCRNSGKALECLHKRDAMSSNKNAATMEDSLLFYRPGVERQIAARENQGEVTSNKGLLISRQLVDSWKAMRVPVTVAPRVIYLSVDTGGGSVGHMGVAAHIEQRNYELGIIQMVVGKLYSSFFFRFTFLFPGRLGGFGSSSGSGVLYSIWKDLNSGMLRLTQAERRLSTIRGIPS